MTSDLPGIAAVQAESWRDAYADVLPDEYLAGPLDRDLQRHWGSVDVMNEDVILVAEEGALIGFIAVWCRPEAFIDNLHVKPSSRSSGVGTALMQSAAGKLLCLNHTSAFLWVLASNERAIRFYERLGGQCTEREVKSHFGHDFESLKVVWPDLQVIQNG